MEVKELSRRDASGRYTSINSHKYSAIHKWLVKHHGNPEKCENCGVPGAKNKGGRWTIQWANISGEYLRDVADFMGLCVSCHFKKDQIILNIKRMRRYYA